MKMFIFFVFLGFEVLLLAFKEFKDNITKIVNVPIIYDLDRQILYFSCKKMQCMFQQHHF